jgi:hypothetical protein
MKMAHSGYMIGIDCGKSGGFAVSHNGIHCAPIPATDGDWVDTLREHRLIASGENLCPVAYVEEVPSFCGKMIPSSRSFVLGKHYGFTLGALQALGYEVRLVRPQAWQKAVGMARTKGMGQTAWKNKLKGEAQRRFPDLKITLKTSDALLVLAHGLSEIGKQ